MFLDSDDLWHPLRHDLPGGDVDVRGGGAACEHRAQVVGDDRGITQDQLQQLNGCALVSRLLICNQEVAL